MKLIVGLGNPGKKYVHTRHNIGFRIVERLALEEGVNLIENKKFKAKIVLLQARPEHLVLVEPLTMMNASGEAVFALKEYYKIGDRDILIVHDEVDLPFGKIKVSAGAGSAGHQGVASILTRTDQSQLARIRVGIGNRKNREEISTEEYVLQNFTQEEKKQLEEKVIPQAISEIKNRLALT